MDRSISHEYMPIRFPAIRQYPSSVAHGRAEHYLPPSQRPMASRKAPKRSHADRAESPVGNEIICQFDDSLDCNPKAINGHTIVKALTLLRVGAKGYLTKCNQGEFMEFFREVNDLTVEVAALGVEDPGKCHLIARITQELVVRYKEVLTNSAVIVESTSCQSNQVLSSNHSNLSQSGTLELNQPPAWDQPLAQTNDLDFAVIQGRDIPADGSCFIFTTKETWNLAHNKTLKDYIRAFGARDPTVKGAELARRFYNHCKQHGKRLYCVQRSEETGKRPTATKNNWHNELFEPLKQNEAYDVLKHPMNTALEELWRHEKERPSAGQQKSWKCTGNESTSNQKPKSSIQDRIDLFNHSNHGSNSSANNQVYLHSPIDNQRNSIRSCTSQLEIDSLHTLENMDIGELEVADISEGALNDPHFWDRTSSSKDDIGEIHQMVKTSPAAAGNDAICHNWSEKIQSTAVISNKTSESTNFEARSLPAFSVLCAKIFSKCPCLVLVVPAERTITKQRTGPQKFLINYICQHSLRIIEKPLEVCLSRRCLKQVAPFLKISLVLLKWAAHCFGLPLPIPEVDISILSQMLDDLCKEKNGDWRRFERALMNGQIDDATIREYQAHVYPSYERFGELATNPEYVNNWRANITTVPVSHDTSIWVKKEYAHLYADPSLANTRSGDGTGLSENSHVLWDASSKSQRSIFKAMPKMRQQDSRELFAKSRIEMNGNIAAPVELESSVFQLDDMRDEMGKVLEREGESNAPE